MAMTDRKARSAGPEERATHAGDDGPAPAGGDWRNRRRVSARRKQSVVLAPPCPAPAAAERAAAFVGESERGAVDEGRQRRVVGRAAVVGETARLDLGRVRGDGREGLPSRQRSAPPAAAYFVSAARIMRPFFLPGSMK